MNADVFQERRSNPAVLVAGLIWAAAYIVALFVPKFLMLEPWLRVAVALLPVPAFGYFLLVEIRAVRCLDELQQRIQLEALAVAFPFAVLLLMALGLLERVIELPVQDLSYRHVWPMLVMIYFAALAAIRRRYL